MRVAVFSDKEGSAIWRLAEMNRKRWPHLNVVHVPVHPKRPEQTSLDAAREAIAGADLLHFEYWKTGVMLRNLIPEANKKPCILTHHNEHNLEGSWEWKNMEWAAHVVKNGWQKEVLIKQGYNPILIRHAVEFENFSYIEKLTSEKTVGYVGQIKKVKGVREIKQACDILGYRLIVVGNPSEAGYWEELPKNNVMFCRNVPDEKIGGIYHQMRVFVCNSDDGTESGTMPILEAMVAGIPVVTRKVGLTRDCGKDGHNMLIRKGGYQDVQDLANALKMVVENEDVANEIRNNAWRTVRQYHPEVQAREYEKLYRKVLYPNEVPVSIIIPTYERYEVLKENLAALEEQNYGNFEVVIGDDSRIGNQEELPKKYKFPLKQVYTGKAPGSSAYGLAKARNVAAIEATGEILVFCDDRLKMHPNAIHGFVKKLQEFKSKKAWVWGSKGAFKSFVENFSATWRKSLIEGGMFNERIDRYGGMTQEISARFAAQGFDFKWCPEALAEPILSTHSKAKHREDIIASKVKLYKMGLQ